MVRPTLELPQGDTASDPPQRPTLPLHRLVQPTPRPLHPSLHHRRPHRPSRRRRTGHRSQRSGPVCAVPRREDQSRTGTRPSSQGPQTPARATPRHPTGLIVTPLADNRMSRALREQPRLVDNTYRGGVVMAQATASVQTYTCQACGEEWSRPTARGQRPKWCPDCRASGRCDDRSCPICGIQAVRRNATHCSRICRRIAAGLPTSSPLFFATCSGGCGRIRTASDPTASFVCRRCSALARLHVATHDPRRWVGGRCRRCGDSFLTTTTTDLPIWCSDRCKKADGKATKRARSFGVHVEVIERWRVFEENDWTCWLCRQAIDPTITDPNEDDAGTIDHVVPLASGGRHAHDNLLPAHRACNTIKGIEQVAAPY